MTGYVRCGVLSRAMPDLEERREVAPIEGGPRAVDHQHGAPVQDQRDCELRGQQRKPAQRGRSLRGPGRACTSRRTDRVPELHHSVAPSAVLHLEEQLAVSSGVVLQPRRCRSAARRGLAVQHAVAPIRFARRCIPHGGARYRNRGGRAATGESSNSRAPVGRAPQAGKVVRRAPHCLLSEGRKDKTDRLKQMNYLI